MSNKNTPKLEKIAVVGKFNDGKCRQILINYKTQNAVISAILVCEKEIRVLDKPLEGLDMHVNLGA